MKKLLLALSLVILVSAGCGGGKIYGTSRPFGEVTVENSYKAPLDKSPEETSNPEVSITIPKEKSPDIKTSI